MLVLRIGQYSTVVLHDVAHNDVDIAAGDAQALHTQHNTTQVTTPHVSATLRLLGTWPKHESIPWRENRISPHGHPATAARPLLSSTAPMPAVQAGVPMQPSDTRSALHPAHAHTNHCTVPPTSNCPAISSMSRPSLYMVECARGGGNGGGGNDGCGTGGGTVASTLAPTLAGADGEASGRGGSAGGACALGASPFRARGELLLLLLL